MIDKDYGEFSVAEWREILSYAKIKGARVRFIEVQPPKKDEKAKISLRNTSERTLLGEEGVGAVTTR